MRNPVYGCKLYVGVGRTAEECAASLPPSISAHLKDDLPQGTGWTGYTFDINDGIFVIILRANKLGNVPYDSIFHEVAHATAWMCKFHGVKVDPEDHEAYAYLQGWVGTQVMKTLDSYKKRLKQPALNNEPKPAIIYTEKLSLPVPLLTPASNGKP